MRNSVLRWSWKFHGKILKNLGGVAFWASVFYAKKRIIIMSIFRGFLDISAYNHILSYKSQKTCNPRYNAYFWFSIFWATFGGEMGVATICTSNGLGSPNPAKNLANWKDLLGQSLSQNQVSEIFEGEPPSLRCILY